MTNATSRLTNGPFFWIIAILALLWNALGCVNLVQQMSPTGIATLPPEYQTFIETRPSWAFIAFAVSVIAGVLGAILLMMRNGTSVTAFLLSAIGALVATIPALSGGIMSVVIGSAMSVILGALFAWYAKRAT